MDDNNGITAYHGSPHDFEKFDTSKIGTGEGAQVYGHGLYFAEHEPVAIGYREKLAPKANIQLGKENLTKESLRQIANELELPYAAATTANAFGRLQTSDSVQNYLDRLNQIDREELRKSFPQVAAEVDSEHALISELHSRGLDIDRPNKGHMYEVHIDAHPDHFLDWDRPLSEQPHVIKNVMTPELVSQMNQFRKGYGLGNVKPDFSDIDGESLYAHLSQPISGVKGNDKLASQHLLSRGIQGIKYLDAGSRSSGAGSRNYVVFDHDRVKVRRKYEQGGRIGYAGGGGDKSYLEQAAEFFGGSKEDGSDNLYNRAVGAAQDYVKGKSVSDFIPDTSGLMSQRDIDELKQYTREKFNDVSNFAGRARDVGSQLYSGAQDVGRKAISGINEMAEQASREAPAMPERLRHAYEQYMNPQAPAPQRMGRDANEGAAPSEPRYVAPDGSGEMWHESKIKSYYQNLQRNFYKEDAEPAPQQAQPDYPVFIPEKKAWDWPEAYKNVMRGEPEMAWTKGMTPRERPQPQPQPQQVEGGSLFGEKGGNGVSAGRSGEPLGVLVGHQERQIAPKDVYTGTNPVHMTQTMVAPSPEYEGQEVKIPDTPEDMMGEYHLGRVYAPMTFNKNYKAQTGLNNYTPPRSEKGMSFPTKEDVDFYRSVDATYGTPEAGYLQEGARGNFYNDPIKMSNRQGGVRRPLTKDELDASYAAYMAAQRNPVSALGFQPDKFDYSSNPVPFDTAGETFVTSDRMFADPKFPSVMVHEPFHYGIAELQSKALKESQEKRNSLIQQMKRNVEEQKANGYTTKNQNEFEFLVSELKKLHDSMPEPIFKPNSSSDKNNSEEQENYVRGMMLENFGPIEKYELQRQGFDSPVFDEYAKTAPAFLAANADRRRLAEELARQELMKRRAMLGPRASGGRTQDRPHYGFGGEGEGPEAGSTGSAAGNSYGGGGQRDTGPSSESVSDSSNDSGSSFGGGGNGGRSAEITSARLGDTPGFQSGTQAGWGIPSGAYDSFIGGGGGYGDAPAPPNPQGNAFLFGNRINSFNGVAPNLSETSNDINSGITTANDWYNTPLVGNMYVKPSLESQLGAIQPATERQQRQIANVMNIANNPSSGYVPSDFATQAQLARDYQLGAAPLAHPGQTPDAYLSTGPSASVGRQNYTPSTPSADTTSGGASSVRSDFNNAFADAAASGKDTFEWTNPVTGIRGVYAVKFRKSGGRLVPVAHNPKPMYSPEIVEHVLSKISAAPPALDPNKVAKRGRP
jgi:hypothetical protein